MKCEELETLLTSFASFCASAEVKKSVDALLPVLQVCRSKNVTWLVEKLNSFEITNESEVSLQNASNFVTGLCQILNPVIKPPVARDLAALAAAINRQIGLNSQQIAERILGTPKTAKSKKSAPPSIRSDIVSQLSRQLEDALGDEIGFPSLFSELESRKDIRPKEMIAIAKQFVGAATSSRATALKKIYSRHQALIISRAKSAATGGRVAG